MNKTNSNLASRFLAIFFVTLSAITFSSLCEAANTSQGCGAANGTLLVAPPAASNLCTTGTASTVSGFGPYSWTCSGSSQSCTAYAAPDIWFTPNPNTVDYQGLFQTGAPWQNAASQVNVFEIPGSIVNPAYVSGLTSDIPNIISFLKSHNITLAMGDLPLTVGTNGCGSGVEGYGATYAATSVEPALEQFAYDALQLKNTYGANIQYFGMDEPLYFGHYSTTGCQSSIDAVAQNVAQTLKQVQTIYPNVNFGEVEPMGVPDNLNDPINPTNTWLADLKIWFDAYHTATGNPLAYFRVDMSWNSPLWKGQMQQLGSLLKAEGIPLQIIYDGSGNTDAAETAQATTQYQDYEMSGLPLPDDANFQFWTKTPTHILPESNPLSETGLMDGYIQWRKSRVIPGLSASGTTMPPAANITDSYGTVWTIVNGKSYENGVLDGGNGMTLLLYYNYGIYAYAGGNWWSHTSGSWQEISGDPRVTPSASETTIPPASRIIDSIGTVWTLVNGNTYENGVADGGTNMTSLLYYDYGIYADSGSGWWTHIMGSWQKISGSPQATPLAASVMTMSSLNGVTISTSKITDSTGTVWTQVNGHIYENGVAVGGNSVSLLLYYNNEIYAYAGGNFWSLVSGSWRIVSPVLQITDSYRVHWMLINGKTYENGIADGGNNMTSLDYYNNEMYAQAGSVWWSHAAGSWQEISGAPQATPSSANGTIISTIPASANGTTVPTSVTQIVDSYGVIWTLVNGKVYENGFTNDGNNLTTLLLYYNNVVYADLGSEWWSYATGPIPSDPRVTPPANTTAVSPAPSAQVVESNPVQIVDRNGEVWNLENGYTYENGIADGGTGISFLLYYNEVIYALTAGNQWWSHATGSWQGIPGDPRATSSANGTTMPPAAQIIDSQGTIWTVVNGRSYENGVADGGNGISLLLYYNYGIYSYAGGNWWSHATGSWQGIPGDPRATSSANGTTMPPAAQIIDSQGTVWTVVNGRSYENGVADGGNGISLLLYYNYGIYSYAGGNWWSHATGSWQGISGDPRATSSANGTTMPPAAQIIDSQGTVWTVVNGRSYENGVADGGNGISLLLYYNYGIYSYAGGNWWSHALGSWQGISGDPRVTSSANGTTMPPAAQIIDSQGTVWTVVHGNSYENGVADGGNYISLLLYYNYGIYSYAGGNWWSHATGSWQGISGDPRLLSAPVSLTAVAGNTQVSLIWSASSAATSYMVKRSTTSGGPYTAIANGVTTTSYTDYTLKNGTTYYYVVSAYNSTSGSSTNSAQVSATPST